MDLYTLEKVSKGVTRITDLTQVHMYLVEGSERALLIDTGTGIGNLKEYVDTLTRLPLTVVCTHGHVDHAGGAAAFLDVYLHPADQELVKRHCTQSMKKNYAEFVLGDLAEPIMGSEYMSLREAPFLSLTDQQEFDLGGIVVCAILVQGHTQGMTCMLIREERTILFGDACNQATFLFSEEASSIEKYRQSLLQLKAMEEQYDTVLFSHGPGIGPKSILDDCIECCDAILAGEADNEELIFMGETSYMAKKTENGVRIDGRLGNVIFPCYISAK